MLREANTNMKNTRPLLFISGVLGLDILRESGHCQAYSSLVRDVSRTGHTVCSIGARGDLPGNVRPEIHLFR